MSKWSLPWWTLSFDLVPVLPLPPKRAGKSHCMRCMGCVWMWLRQKQCWSLTCEEGDALTSRFRKTARPLFGVSAT